MLDCWTAFSNSTRNAGMWRLILLHYSDDDDETGDGQCGWWVTVKTVTFLPTIFNLTSKVIIIIVSKLERELQILHKIYACFKNLCFSASESFGHWFSLKKYRFIPFRRWHRRVAFHSSLLQCIFLQNFGYTIHAKNPQNIISRFINMHHPFRRGVH